jgi:hypothetical protein
MTERKHNVNVLTFSHPEKELTFGFKLQKSTAHSPLRRGEFPLELWSNHREELKDIKNLYCDFKSTENCDYVSSVDLTKSIFFAKHYYHFRIAEYFRKVAHVVHPNFINAATIWFLSNQESTPEYKVYYKFTLSVRLKMITDKPELIVTFDGTSKVLNKSILQLVSEDISTDNLNWLVRNGELINYEDFSDEENNYLDEFYPVLNPDLADALKYPPEPPKKNDDRYANYYNNISGLLNKYLDTEEFKKVIPHSAKWHELDSVSLTSEGTNLLKFGKGTHTDPYEGLKNYKPCTPAPPGHYRFFFICHESDTETANRFHEYSTRERGFIKFAEFLSLPITYDKELHITFKNLENPLPEIEEKLSGYSLIPETNYLAIYISPYSKYEPDPVKRNYYYRIKQLLLKYKISSQVIYNKNINKDNFKFHVSNIAVAVLAKLGGIPWRLDREINNELIVGIGAFRTKKYNTRYIGSTFCFANDGRFKNFNVLPANNHKLLAGAIREAVESYKNQHQETERLIIHFYKRMSQKEISPIIRQLKSIDKNIPIIIVTVNKSESSDLVLFDMDYVRKMPYSGTYIPIGMNSYILCNNTRYKPSLNGDGEHSQQEIEREKKQLDKQLKSFSLPVKLHLQSTDESIIKDPEEVKKLIDQVYQFSRMYWKSVSQQSLPVTTKYPQMVAEIFPHFESGRLYEFGKKNLWFL